MSNRYSFELGQRIALLNTMLGMIASVIVRFDTLLNDCHTQHGSFIYLLRNWGHWGRSTLVHGDQLCQAETSKNDQSLSLEIACSTKHGIDGFREGKKTVLQFPLETIIFKLNRINDMIFYMFHNIYGWTPNLKYFW